MRDLRTADRTGQFGPRSDSVDPSIKFFEYFFYSVVRGNDSCYQCIERMRDFREFIFPNEKEFYFAKFCYSGFGLSFAHFYNIHCKVKVEKTGFSKEISGFLEVISGISPLRNRCENNRRPRMGTNVGR